MRSLRLGLTYKLKKLKEIFESELHENAFFLTSILFR